MNLGLSDTHLSQITDALSHTAITKANVFGSRAKGNHKYYSDIDICIFGDRDGFKAETIHGILDELHMPYKFDVVSYDTIKNPALRDHIDRNGVEIYARKE
jgi:predicted nucleotidyltransferase